MFPRGSFEKAALYLIAASRGGPMRAKIMALLIERPRNANMLSEMLGVDYKTVRHHLEVLEKNNWVVGSKVYGGAYRSTFIEEEKAVFMGLASKLGKNLK